MSVSPVKKGPAMRASCHSTVAKSANTTPARKSFLPGKVREIPLEHDAKYTISYVPGMSEHAIDTGKTHEDARMKIVLLTCELERVNTYNYTLVRENEVLRVQANKSERERDLETKLAIVLAENEKLNQIIEEVYEVYMSTRHHEDGHHDEEYERRLMEVYEDLEEWKSKYNALESQTNVVELQNHIKELETHRDLLNDQLARKDRDLDALRAHLTSTPEVHHNNNEELHSHLSALAVENNSLKRELEVMHLKYGDANALQLKLSDYENKVRTVLGENTKLNDALIQKVHECNDLNAKLTESRSASRVHEYSVNLSPQVDHRLSSAAHHVVVDNSAVLSSQIRDLESRLAVTKDENQRLSSIIHEKESQILYLHNNNSPVKDQSGTVDRLTIKIKELIQQNDNLNRLCEAKANEVNALYLKSREGDGHEYKEKIILLASENERLNELVKHKLEEIESMRKKIYDLQISTTTSGDLHTKIALISTENERLVGEVESLRRRVRDDRSGDLIAQINYLQSEKVRLEGLISEKSREIELLKHDNVRVVESNITEFNKQNERLKSAGIEQKRKITELEGRISQMINLETKTQYLSIETERLAKEIAERDSRIVSLTQKLSEKDREATELHLKLQSLEGQRHHEMESVTIKVQAEHERKVMAIRDEHGGQVQKLIAEKKELEDRIRSIQTEFERLQTLAKESRVEAEEWKNKYNQAQNASDKEFEELRRQFEGLKSMSLMAKDMQHKFAAERTAYETQILQLSQIVSDLEHKTELLTSENERVTTLSVQRLHAIEDLKKSSNEETYKLEIYELKNQVEVAKSSAYDVKQMTLQYNSEKAAAQAKITELTQVNANLKSDLEKLRDLMEKRKADVESISKQNEDLRKMCEKLNTQNKSSVRTETTEELKTRITELELSRNEFQRQAERNALELTRKNRELIDKIQELDILKLKYEEGLANYQALNSQMFARLSMKK